MKLSNPRTLSAATSLLLLGTLVVPGYAGEVVVVKDGKKVTEAAAAESRFKIYGWVEAGVTFNHDSPDDRQNFGRLFDDRSNEPMLNQAVITAERVLVADEGWDWGFKAQFMYGSDARFIHSLGILDNASHDIIQPDLVEAYLSLHAPVLTPGGIDFKVGKFVTLEGAETIDPRTNVFYSHSYIFNYGIPFNHTGLLATMHVNKNLDVYAGVTRGVNTSWDDNNSSWAFHGGIGTNFEDGKIAVIATTHIGPETPDNNHDYRYLNDLLITAKLTEKLTSITDLNYIQDDAASAKAWGVAQYLTYAVNDWLTAGIRGEVFRDDDGFFVAQFANNDDFIDLERGEVKNYDPRTVGGGRTTYGALTLGATIKPSVPKPLSGLMIRPELRYDRSLNSTRPFNDSTDRDQFTAALDVIVAF